MVDEQKLRQLATRASQLANLEANELAQVMDDAAAAILDLIAALESKQQAAKTWENEADRRSKRYTKAAVELEQAQAERISLLDELQTLREERTAWRVTAENAEAAVKQARIDALEEARSIVRGYVIHAGDADRLSCAIESLKGKTP